MRLDYIPELPRLRVPSLWVRGDHDPLVGNAEITAAAAAARGELVTISDAGHIVTYDQPREFSRVARDLLSTALE